MRLQSDFEGSPFDTKTCPVCGHTATEGADYWSCDECGLRAPFSHDRIKRFQSWVALNQAIRGKPFGWGALCENYRDSVEGEG